MNGICMWLIVSIVANVVLLILFLWARREWRMHESMSQHYRSEVRRIQNMTLKEIEEYHRMSQDPKRRPSFIAVFGGS